MGRHTDAIADGVLAGSGWLDREGLVRMTRWQKGMPWLKAEPVRARLGMTHSRWLLFRILAFERWYQRIAA